MYIVWRYSGAWMTVLFRSRGEQMGLNDTGGCYEGQGWMLPLQQGWPEWWAVVKMGECSSLCSPQIYPLADILGQQEHRADVLPCRNHCYRQRPWSLHRDVAASLWFCCLFYFPLESQFRTLPAVIPLYLTLASKGSFQIWGQCKWEMTYRAWE